MTSENELFSKYYKMAIHVIYRFRILVARRTSVHVCDLGISAFFVDWFGLFLCPTRFASWDIGDDIEPIKLRCMKRSFWTI